MPNFTSTITINAAPAITVSLTNVSYEQVKNSLGDFVYFVDTVYIAATNYAQVTGVATFTHYDANGNQRYVSLTPTVDPYQSQPAIYYDLKNYKVIFDGNSEVSFYMLPNTLLQLTFYSERISKEDWLDLYHINNFLEWEKIQEEPKFFDGYCDTI